VATPKKSALSENAGILQPNIVSIAAIAKIQNFRNQKPSIADLISGIITGNKTALSRAITIIESNNVDHQKNATEIVNKCLPHANKSIRIGITGVPGVGKSTFIEAFGLHLTSLGKKVAVLAVDPSSTISHGSILGDKTRMEQLVNNPNAFIRPTASGETLGGVARKTRETIVLCEAAGYDVVLIETVGVGQSETAVHSMVDFFLLLKISGAGDGLQGIKRGIMEMADAVVINKADGDNVTKANLAKTEFGRALHLFSEKKSGWIPRVATCSAIENTGIDAVWKIISDYFELTSGNNFFQENRTSQNLFWMMETINDRLKSNFYDNENIKKMILENSELISKNEKSPFEAANELLDFYFGDKI
jgi:LAO/AO transport system kinase